ncbi:MAG: hypothetical protein WD696_17425 [Bryobacteraceae bacterium]
MSQKKVKDQGEYDIFTAIGKETDPKKKLTLLDTWKQKYPETEFQEERLQHYLLTYQGLGQPAKMFEIAKEMLAKDPKALQGLYWIVSLLPTMNDTSDATLGLGEKSANGLLVVEKPAAAGEADWVKAKKDMDAMSYKTLGWIAWQRKDNEAAERQFVKCLEFNPNAAEVSYWLGTVIFGQKKPERQSEVLFHFARAASFEGQGALNPQGRKQVDAFFIKAYTTFHGSQQGISEIRTLAKSQPLPPPGFKIENVNEIAAQKEQEFRESNPQLALWMGLKKELTGPNGAQYFESMMKNAAVPKLKGKVISQTPASRPKEVVIGISDATEPEVKLKFETALANKADVGTEIEFEGVPTEFAPDPFMVTFEVENEKLTGWPPPPAPAKRAPGRKRGASK